jgi:hypothetical protein
MKPPGGFRRIAHHPAAIGGNRISAYHISAPICRSPWSHARDRLGPTPFAAHSAGANSRAFLEIAGVVEPAGKLAAHRREECQTAWR